MWANAHSRSKAMPSSACSAPRPAPRRADRPPRLHPGLTLVSSLFHRSFAMNPLKPGQRVTLLKIDDMMALCHRYELEVREVLEPARVGYEGRKQRVATVRQKGKRKEFYLDLAADDIVLDGWN